MKSYSLARKKITFDTDLISNLKKKRGYSSEISDEIEKLRGKTFYSEKSLLKELKATFDKELAVKLFDMILECKSRLNGRPDDQHYSLF